MGAGSAILRLPVRLFWLITQRGYRRFVVDRLKRRCGYDFEHWSRIEMNRCWTSALSKLDLQQMDVLQISPREDSLWGVFQFGSYEATHWPAFDICKMQTGKQYDLIFADQVFEHIEQPHAGVQNVHCMLREGGFFFISTPFLVRVHGAPNDFHRWTENGLKLLLEEGGFSSSSIKTGSWGNRACVKANFRDWAAYGWRRPMQNEANFPVVVWAIAKRKMSGITTDIRADESDAV